MIKISNMFKSYSSKYSGKQEVFKDFTINFPSKGFVSILGKSGCGKTTLLNIIGGIDSIDKGYVNVFGYDISNYSNGNTLIDEYRKDVVGFVFQNYNLINNISVYRNLALPLEMQGLDDQKIDLKIQEVLKRVDLIDYKNRMPYELSGGQQQRVAIARALIKDSKVVLADEPTGNLDSTTATDILNLLKEISKDRLIIFITHDQEYADKYSDNIIQIKDGEIINEYNCVIEEQKKEIKKAKSRIGFKSLIKNSITNLKLNLVKSLLIVLLFSTTIAVMANAVVLITTSEAEVLEKVVSSRNDEYITPITQAYTLESDGIYALNDYTIYSNIYEIYDEYINIQEKYGAGNVLLSSRINIVNHTVDPSSLYRAFDNISERTRINFLKEGIDYNIPNLEGRMPKNGNEIIITDLVSNILFGRDDALGEIIKINRYEIYTTFVEKELVVVGIINTNYLENNHDDWQTHFDDFYYSGKKDWTDAGYFRFYEQNIYLQLYGLEQVFEDIDIMHQYAGHKHDGNRHIDGIMAMNFYYVKSDEPWYISGLFYSGKTVDKDTLVGRLPISDNEISIDIDQLTRLLPDNLDTIQDLIDGNITWDDFIQVVELNEVEVSYYYEHVEEHYSDIVPTSLTIVGAFEKESSYSDQNLVFSDELLIKLNNAFPYRDLGLSFINKSPYLENQLIDITNDDFISIHDESPIFESKVIINAFGVFNLYRALNTVESDIIPLIKTIFTGLVIFTFILLFLYSYLSIINNQKRIGIFRSLGFRRNDILKMFLIENGLILLISLIIGGLASMYTLSQVNNVIFSNTIFADSMLYNYDLNSILITLAFTSGLIITTAVMPLIKILRMTPINIINK